MKYVYCLAISLSVAFGLSLGQTGFSIQCGGVGDSTGASALTSLDEDTLRALVVFASGGSDCPAIDGQNRLKPAWANQLFDASFEGSIAQYYLDNSRGALLLNATVASRGDDSCFYSRHIPCNFPWTSDNQCASCPNNCATYCGPSPCECEWDSFYTDIMSQVDALYDLNEFDRIGAPGGGPDGHLDLLVFISYGPYGADAGLGRLSDTIYVSQEDGITIRPNDGCIVWDFTDWYETVTLVSHELGHTMVAGEQKDHYGYAHLGQGSFNIMATGGFYDSTLSIVYPSLHNPISRGSGDESIWDPFPGLNWITTHDVQGSLFDVTMNPYCDPNLTYGNQGDCYRMKSPADTNQWFVVTAHNRRSVWERYWPAAGLAVWRMNQTVPLPLPGWYNLRLELEAATGYWEWDTVGTHEGFPVVVRTEIRNDATGTDSLDYLFTIRSGDTTSIFSEEAGYRGAGGPSYLFSPGYEMDDHGNPCSRLRVLQLPGYPRLLNTGFALRNIRQPDNTYFIADLIANAWQGTATQSQTWFDTVNVVGTVTFSGGSTLTIQPGTVIRVAPGAFIYCRGRLDARGTVTQPIVFEGSGQGEWFGIRVQSNDLNNRLEYVTIRGARHGVLVSYGNYARMDHVTAENCTQNGIVYVGATGSVTNCVLRNNAIRGVYLIRSAVTLTNNQVYGNDAYGLRLWGCNYTPLTENDIHDNGDAHDTTYAYWPGIQVLEGAVGMSCNKVRRNAGPGLMLLPQGYAYAGTNAGRNYFQNNMQAMGQLPADFGQIYLQGGTLDIECGLNTIEDSLDAHFLIRNYQEEMPPYNWNAEWNYWGETNTAHILSRITWHPDIEPLLSQSYDCSDPHEPIECTLQQEDLLFREGWDRERAAQFADAIPSYENYLTLYPKGKYAATVTDRLMFCKKADDWSWADIRAYFLGIAADSSKDSAVVVLCKANAAWCLIEMDQWDAGYAELDSLLDHDQAEYVKVSIALKKLLSELKSDDGELQSMPGDPSGQHGRGASTVDEAEEAFDAKLARIDREVDALLTGITTGGAPETQDMPALPKAYALYPNYPNPFNPITEIRFDLPENAQVEVAIFNTLGQRVTTLVNDTRDAGTYRVRWDGSSAASGMYLCQLKAGNFVQTRKLMLLK